MIRFLLAVLAASLCISEPSFAQDDVPFDASTVGVDGDVIAFVGKKVFVKEVVGDDRRLLERDPSTGLITTHGGILYESRFEIIEVVSGKLDGATIDFLTYGHWGGPGFAGVKDTVLIFVDDGPENYQSSKEYGVYYDVSRTSDGDWAACGDSYVQNGHYVQYGHEGKDKEPLEPIPFLNPVIVNIPSILYKVSSVVPNSEDLNDKERAKIQIDVDESNKMLNEAYQPPIWKRDGDTATCQLGTRAFDLYEFQKQTEFLPRKRDKICTEKYVSEDDWNTRRQLIKDCKILMGLQNLP